MHTLCCDSGSQATGGPIRDAAGVIEGLGGNHDESAADLCRTVSQSLRKNPQLGVCREIPVESDNDTEFGHIVGYDRELRLAWRRLQDGTRQAEISSPLLPSHRWPVDPTGTSTQTPTSRAKSSKRQRQQTTNETCQLLCGWGSSARANIECS